MGAIKKFLRWEAAAIIGLLLAFLMPFDAEHFNQYRVPDTIAPVTTDNLVELEETAFNDIMKHVRSGNQDRAFESASNYLKLYPLGRHYYEVYRIFKTNRLPAEEQ